MMDALVSAAIVATLKLAPGIPPPAVPDQSLRMGSFREAAGGFESPSDAVRVAQTPSPRRDSLKNGAIIGAIAGGVTGAYLAAVGCALDDVWGGEQSSSCAGGTILMVAMGAGLGAGIGVGVDALFEQAPSSAVSRRKKPVGLRVRVTF